MNKLEIMGRLTKYDREVASHPTPKTFCPNRQRAERRRWTSRRYALIEYSKSKVSPLANIQREGKLVEF